MFACIWVSGIWRVSQIHIVVQQEQRPFVLYPIDEVKQRHEQQAG
jgi:hypothetical protein